jgi:hypothetical protein
LNKEEKELKEDLEKTGKFLVQNNIDENLKQEIFHSITNKF